MRDRLGLGTVKPEGLGNVRDIVGEDGLGLGGVVVWHAEETHETQSNEEDKQLTSWNWHRHSRAHKEPRSSTGSRCGFWGCCDGERVIRKA